VIHILTGPVHSGKTTLLKKIILELKRRRFKIDGFLSEPLWDNQKIMGYDLLDLREDKSCPFIRKAGEKDWDRIGPFYFIPETLDLAKHIIKRDKKMDICVVDEVGPLELSGKGLWPVLKEALSKSQPHYLLVVRITILEKFLSKINREDVRVFDTEEKDMPTEMLESLMHELKKLGHS
jgi:iron complex transport system ATP-binding protein